MHSLTEKAIEHIAKGLSELRASSRSRSKSPVKEHKKSSTTHIEGKLCRKKKTGEFVKCKKK